LDNLASADDSGAVLDREFETRVKAACLSLGPDKPEECPAYRTGIETMRVRVLVLSVVEGTWDPEVMDRSIAGEDGVLAAGKQSDLSFDVWGSRRPPVSRHRHSVHVGSSY
jgi:hypothetical protein